MYGFFHLHKIFYTLTQICLQAFLIALFFLPNYLILFPFSSSENLLFLIIVRVELISFFVSV
ncbi:hypothetical protein GBM72_02620 [Enterococcus faecium]|nr:hypothetical protein GBM33_02620 [Enterococcus faecium]KAB7604812.1 hypothetical protein GBM72_02620 [Enterococcus faecium]KAB7607440.1 hypothetical protein GBM36_02620 [Enterococcus faecium]